MLKSILAILLSLSLTSAVQAASPITLLAQQCLPYEVLLDDIDSTDTAEKAVALERQLIGLFNLKDSVNYYRQFSINTDDKELLLQCQLRLADEFAKLAHRPNIETFSQQLQHSSSVNEQRLGQRLSQLITRQTSLQQKATLHTTEAGLKYALRHQSLSLVIGEHRCLLPSDGAAPAKIKAPFSESIAAYLIEQQDSQCRQQVWQAYQLRAKDKNQQALQYLFDVKQNLAAQQGYLDYAHYVLADQQLSSPKSVNQFLDAITDKAPAPWDIGQTLSAASPTPIEPIFSQIFLQKIYQELKVFDVTIEEVDPQVLRVWHQQRLLGEIYLRQGNTPQAQRVRQSVIGHQFGQVSLAFPGVLTDYRTQQQLIDALSDSLAQLIKGGHYYLLNTLGDSQDTNEVGQHWLSLYLSNKLLPAVVDGSREDYLYRYATQLKVFRSKLALGFYQGTLDPQKYQYEFSRSFNQGWPQAQDAIYSFTGMINQGPLYYKSLWQKHLAQLIFQNNKDHQDQKQLFATLMINEAQLSFSQQLATIFGRPISPSFLIERIQHGQR
ncbi:M3 family metallopeptidase [Shewanella psychrotolerans]|uniref:M3 family metallopeptidase n=1 Tax=Shewanella psychrotolerans TaxID=2864206 RepID=UPI001C65D17B|nr:M3 family metallopeptidase [Shewanella psychrotolerans]QYJ99939.1 peptidase M3 [Shewanella psychrotolerans]